MVVGLLTTIIERSLSLDRIAIELILEAILQSHVSSKSLAPASAKHRNMLLAQLLIACALDDWQDSRIYS